MASTNSMILEPTSTRHVAATNITQEPNEAARVAFEDGIKAFKEMTKDPKKKILAGDIMASYTMQDVLYSVQKARTYYQHDRGQSRTRECLIAFSHRVMHYGNVLDVLVQHHPEYTSLAWGAMKMIFGAIIEHERTGSTIVAALCDISDSLPTAESAITLYPTPMMVKNVSMLYAHIIRFLIRAWKYYDESRLMHAIHSVTRPAALRYDDLLRSIQQYSESVRRLAIMNSQEEVRNVHNEVQGLGQSLATVIAGQQTDSEALICLQGKMDVLTEMLTQFRQTQAWANAAQAKSQLEMHVSMSEVHSSQALLMLQSQCNVDHKHALQTASAEQLYYRKRPRKNGGISWNLPKLRAWDKSESSCTIILKSTYRERVQIRGFCVEVVEQMLKAPENLNQSSASRFKPSSRIVLWILSDRGRTYSLVETLRSLVFQVLSFKFTAGNISPSEISCQVTKFRDAYFEEDYLKMLGSLLHNFKLVYIVVNAEAFAPSTAAECRDTLSRLSRMLSDGSSQTVLKIITTAYGPLERRKDVDAAQDLVLDIGRARGRKLVKQQLGRPRARR